MNRPLHFNPKWGIVTALCFGLLFFLLGFGGFLMERQNLLSDTIRYLEKAGSYTALKEKVKGLSSEEAVPVWNSQSGMELIFYYPDALAKTMEPLKNLWSQKYTNFSKIIFSSFSINENWTKSLSQYIHEDPRPFFLGYYPVFRRIDAQARATEKNIIKYQLYLWIPAAFVNSFPEELLYTSLGGKSFWIHREPTVRGTVFELTWDEIHHLKTMNAALNLPDFVTEILTQINSLIQNSASLH